MITGITIFSLSPTLRQALSQFQLAGNGGERNGRGEDDLVLPPIPHPQKY